MTVHTKKFHREERRRQVATLLAQSMTEQEIADKLEMNRIITTSLIVKSLMSIMLIFSSALSLQPGAAAASNSVDIFPPGGKPYGLTYADHIKNFW